MKTYGSVILQQSSTRPRHNSTGWEGYQRAERLSPLSAFTSLLFLEKTLSVL